MQTEKCWWKKERLYLKRIDAGSWMLAIGCWILDSGFMNQQPTILHSPGDPLNNPVI